MEDKETYMWRTLDTLSNLSKEAWSRYVLACNEIRALEVEIEKLEKKLEAIHD